MTLGIVGRGRMSSFTSVKVSAVGRFIPGDLLRITHARPMVERTKLHTYEIAIRTGFQSNAALSRAFKQHFGTTIADTRVPKFYRMIMKWSPLANIYERPLGAEVNNCRPIVCS